MPKTTNSPVSLLGDDTRLVRNDVTANPSYLQSLQSEGFFDNAFMKKEADKMVAGATLCDGMIRVPTPDGEGHIYIEEATLHALDGGHFDRLDITEAVLAALHADDHIGLTEGKQSGISDLRAYTFPCFTLSPEGDKIWTTFLVQHLVVTAKGIGNIHSMVSMSGHHIDTDTSVPASPEQVLEYCQNNILANALDAYKRLRRSGLMRYFEQMLEANGGPLLYEIAERLDKDSRSLH